MNDINMSDDLIERGRYEVSEDRRIADLMKQPNNRDKLLQRAQVAEDLIAEVEKLRGVLVNNETVELLVTNALAYGAGCAPALYSNKRQAESVPTALNAAGYAVVRRPMRDSDSHG